LSTADDLHKGTYKVDGNKIILDDEVEGTINDKKITITDDDLLMVFEMK
jgi:hypothetical protein